MTFEYLLQQKVLRDNITVLKYKTDASGLCDLKELCTLTRNYGIVTEGNLIKAGLDDSYFSYEVAEIWATENKYKLAVVLKEGK